MNEVLIKHCWDLVNKGQKILIVDFFGVKKVYIVNNFSPKIHGTQFNEAINAIDITDLMVNYQFNFGQLQADSIATRIHQIPRQSFKFGHDEFIWLTQIQESF